MNIQINIDEAKLREQLEGSVATIVRRVNWSAKIEEEAVKLASETVSAVVREIIASDSFKATVEQDFRRHLSEAIQKIARGTAKNLLHNIVEKEGRLS